MQATVKANEQILYQAYPETLTASHVKAIASLLFAVLVIILLGGKQAVFWIMWLIVVGDLVLIARNTIFLSQLRVPMLVIRESGLVFRRMSIPWTFIRGVEIMDLPSRGRFVAIALVDNAVIQRPKRNRFVGALAASVLHDNLRRYGAILLPAVRGVDSDALRNCIVQHLSAHDAIARLQ